MRIAWFSPMPPSRSGIAAYSAEVLPLLRRQHHAIDVFVDRDPQPDEAATFNAHDFVWMVRRRPYDLTVYQVGNALCHGYMWAYLLRYPGLVVLHDAQLHQARALWLMRRAYPRYADYPIEFAASEPQAPPAIADVIAAGLGEPAFYQQWPLLRFVLESARTTVVHNTWLRDDLARRYPAAAIEAIDMGVAPVADARRREVRTRHDIPDGATVVAAFGGITPEKRIPSLLRAVAELSGRLPNLHVMLVGEEHGHYDVRADAANCGLANRVHVTGFIADEALPAHLAAADICSCLRWPTNRETSASWLRCLAAGRPTLISALAHHVHLPPIAVQIDVLDEMRELPQAIESLAVDAHYRARLGEAARRHWAAHHRLEQMARAYARVLELAASRVAPRPVLPRHMCDDGSSVLRTLVSELGVAHRLAEFLD